MTKSRPTKFEVCPCCEGHGKSSAYLGDWTASEWAEVDSEWQDNYMAGRFDRACEECNGMRVVEVVDTSRMSVDEVADYEAELDAAWFIRAEQAAERRMGC